MKRGSLVTWSDAVERSLMRNFLSAKVGMEFARNHIEPADKTAKEILSNQCGIVWSRPRIYTHAQINGLRSPEWATYYRLDLKLSPGFPTLEIIRDPPAKNQSSRRVIVFWAQFKCYSLEFACNLKVLSL